MARRLLLEIIGDPAKLLSSLKKSSAAVDTFNTNVSQSQKKIGLTAEQSTRKIIEASIKRDQRLRQEIVAAKQLAATYTHGSAERVAADNLAIAKEKQLARSMSVTAAEAAVHNRNIRAGDVSLGRATRGALAGSGAFSHLGRSLAFASGGFLAFATVSTLLRRSVDEAEKAAATERQLTTQFRAGGLEFGKYKDRLEESIVATSRLSGFTREELSQSFLQAFRGARDFDAGLKLMEASADAARGTGKGLNVVTLALTKAFLGQTGAARRLGVLIPANVKGVAALDFVIRRFRGQAEAGTTAQQRFNAALQLSEITIGTALLPEIEHLLNTSTDWLLQTENQKKIQHDVNAVVKEGAALMHDLGTITGIASDFVGGFHNAIKLLLEVLIARKLYEFAAGETVVGSAAEASAAKVTLLEGALKRLGAIAAIAVAIDVVQRNREEHGGGLPGVGRGLLAEAQGKAGIGPVGVAEAALTAVGVSKSHARLATRVEGDILTFGFAEAARAIPGIFKNAPTPRIPPGDVAGMFGVGPQGFLGTGALRPTGRTGREGPSTRLGFTARFADQELALARAQLTAEQADDRRVLEVEANLIRQRIKRLGNARTTLAERTRLTQQLGQVEGQITAIDQKAFEGSTRFRRMELALAQAQLTETASDDRKILAAEDAAIRSRLSTMPKTKATLDARIALTQQLAGIESQIAGIDQAAKDKQVEALDKQKQAATDQLGKIRDREQALRSKIKEITDAFAQTVDTIRGQIGELFSGPVLQPTERQIKAALGVRFEDLNPKALTKDLNAQVKAFTAFEHGLARLARRGAPKELLKELQGQGLAAAPEVAALAAASPADLRAFFKAFGRRERLAITSARTTMRASLVTLHADRVALRGLHQQEVKVEIEIKGISKKEVKVKTRKTSIAGGRTAGR